MESGKRDHRKMSGGVKISGIFRDHSLVELKEQLPKAGAKEAFPPITCRATDEKIIASTKFQVPCYNSKQHR